jgi:hypothetical protein
MISLEDCLGLCDLSPDEVRAVGEHEHLPDILAAALGSRLLQSEHGAEKIRDMFLGQFRTALQRRDITTARHLAGTLRHFLHGHPEAAFQQRAA